MASSSYTPPCYICRKPSDDQCPLCRQFVCRRCAEMPYEFCCDGEETHPADPEEKRDV